MIMYSCDECGLPFVGSQLITFRTVDGQDHHFDYIIQCLTGWAEENGHEDAD